MMKKEKELKISMAKAKPKQPISIGFIIILASYVAIAFPVLRTLRLGLGSFVLFGAIAGLIGGWYDKISKNKKNSFKISFIGVYIILLFLISILATSTMAPKEEDYFKEIQPLDLPISENTYVDEKYGFKIDYPSGWELIDSPFEEISATFEPLDFSNEYFSPNFNVIVVEEKNRFTKEELLDVNRKTVQKLSEEWRHHLISNKLETILDGDATKTFLYIPSEEGFNIIQMQVRILYKLKIYTITYSSSEEEFYEFLPVVEDSIKTLR